MHIGESFGKPSEAWVRMDSVPRRRDPGSIWGLLVESNTFMASMSDRTKRFAASRSQ